MVAMKQFEAEKTSFIHFIRRNQPGPGLGHNLVVGGKAVQPSESVKVLGVTLDSGLAMDLHIAKVASRAIGKCMALRKIQGFRPSQMHQLYIAAVVPTTDYAAPTWYAPGRMVSKDTSECLSGYND